MRRNKQQIIEHLYDTLKKQEGTRYVFFIDNQFKTINSDSDRAKSMIKEFPDSFIGHYTKDVEKDSLYSDMEWVLSAKKKHRSFG